MQMKSTEEVDLGHEIDTQGNRTDSSGVSWGQQ